MLKRPLFTAALFFAAVIWLLTGMTGQLSDEDPLSAGKKYQLSGQVWRINNKGENTELQLKSAMAVANTSGEKEVFAKTVILNMTCQEFEGSGICPGNRIQAEAVCEGLKKARNEGNFEEEAYYHSLGIQEKFRLKGQFLITDPSVFPLRTLLFRIRNRLIRTINSLDGDKQEGASGHIGIFTAIVTGDRSGLDAETKALYQKSGIAHILAISGLHISFLGMSLFSFFRRRMRFAFAAVLSAVLMISFCLMSGESASAVRATVMFLLRLLAMRYGKTFDLLSALGCSAILLLVSEPMILYNSGFQLSFGAIIGIGLIAPAMMDFLEWKEVKDKQENIQRVFSLSGLRRNLAAAFITCVSVTLFTLPVIINSYYQIPLFSVFLNLLVVPLMGYVLESGMLSALIGIISLFLGRIFAGAGVYLVSLIEILCSILDLIPFSILITGHLSSGKTVIYYGFLLLFLLLSGMIRKRNAIAQKKKREGGLFRNRRFRGVLLMLFLAFLCVLIFPGNRKNCLQITFFDVDQGDGILIESPEGMVILLDGGSSSVADLYQYRLESALKYRGISRIDYAIVSHPDTDHISGLLDLIKDKGAGSIRIGKLLIPSVPDNEKYRAFMEKAEEAGIEPESVKKGDQIKDSQILLTCLHPDKEFYSSDINAYSTVVLLEYGSYHAVFTGDISAEEEKMLLQRKLLMDCDLLKVAHHGSRFSSSKEFLAAADPEIAVISAGVNNSYGHPHKEVLERLRDGGAKVYITAQAGEVEISVDRAGKVSVRTKLNPVDESNRAKI